MKSSSKGRAVLVKTGTNTLTAAGVALFVAAGAAAFAVGFWPMPDGSDTLSQELSCKQFCEKEYAVCKETTGSFEFCQKNLGICETSCRALPEVAIVAEAGKLKDGPMVETYESVDPVPRSTCENACAIQLSTCGQQDQSGDPMVCKTKYSDCTRVCAVPVDTQPLEVETPPVQVYTPPASDASDKDKEENIPPAIPPAEVPPAPVIVTADNWREQARLLPFEDLKRVVKSDNILSLSSDGGRYEVLLPNIGPNAEPYAYYALRRLKLNAEATQAILGRAPYLGNRFVMRLTIDSEIPATGSCCGSASDGYPFDWYYRTEAAYLEGIDLGLPQNAYILQRYWNVATGDHELTHRFVRGSFLYVVYDEGFANYIPKRIQGRQSPHECRSNGFIPYRSGEFTPYLRPTEVFDPRRAYETGECFWWIIEEHYGTEVIPQLFARFRSIPHPDLESFSSMHQSDAQMAYNNMLRVFVPVLGDDAWSVLAGFGVSRDMLNATNR